jgi:hypothetical protein
MVNHFSWSDSYGDLAKENSQDEAVSQRLGKECEWAVQKREEGDFGYVRCARQKS